MQLLLDDNTTLAYRQDGAFFVTTEVCVFNRK